MEVGRIVARVEADLASYDQKMAGAARTFEQTAGKMQASSRAATATIQKTYADRIVAANQSATKEIEAAHRAMRERLKMTQSSGEVAAVRKLYDDRVAAARAGAAREIQIAQQAHLAATQGLRPVVAELDNVVRATGRAGPGLNSLRASFTSVAQSALHLAPGVGQVTSVIGSLALGTAWMTGVLAGVAALTFTVGKLTEGMRAAKKETEEAMERLGRLAKERAQGIFGEVPGDVEKGRAEIARIGKKLIQARLLREGGGVVDVEGLEKQLNEAIIRTAEGVRKIGDIQTEGEDERLRKKEEANRKARAAEEQHVRDLLGVWEFFNKRMELEILPEIVKAQQQAAARARLAQAGLAFGAGTPTQGIPANLTRAQIWDAQQAAGRAAALAFGAGGPAGTPMPSFGRQLGQRLESLIDPKMLLTGLATSGLSTAIGAVSSAALSIGKDLLFGGRAARQFAEEMRKAGLELTRNLQLWAARLTDPSKVPGLEAAADIRARLAEWIEKNMIRTGPPTLRNVGGRIISVPAPMLEVPDLDLAGLIKWIEEWQAANASMFGTQRWEQLDLILIGARAQLKGLGEVAKSVSESLRNVPSGFKIALRRFQATEGVWTPPSSDPFRRGRDLTLPPPGFPGLPLPPGPGLPPFPPTGERAITINVYQQPGEDGAALARKVGDAVLRAQRRGGTTAFNLINR